MRSDLLRSSRALLNLQSRPAAPSSSPYAHHSKVEDLQAMGVPDSKDSTSQIKTRPTLVNRSGMQAINSGADFEALKMRPTPAAADHGMHRVERPAL
jgi:hypothetical protein